MKKILFLLLCAALFACAPASSPRPHLTLPANGIVGGSEIQSNEFQDNPMAAATVAVLWSDDGAGRDIQCTGTLIAPDLVLTAAHCLMDVKNPAQIQIDFLTVSLEESLGLPKMLAKKFFISPLYQQDASNKKADWGLILLPQPAPAGTVITALVPTAWQPTFFQATFALGYGISDDRNEMALNPKNGSGILRQVQGHGLLPLPDDGSGTSGMISWQQQTQGICHGDSGGPLFLPLSSGQPPQLIGITESVIPTDDQADKHLCLGYGYFVNIAEQKTAIEAGIEILRK